jgi:hypothetical protein
MSGGLKLAVLMSKIDCRSGHAQIERILNHAWQKNAQQKVQALVFVGDCMEELATDLYVAARELGSVPCFMFQEGDDPIATKVFLARSRG